ncbi:hypothetical protein FJTKL_10643 [Diaporthe vaccinii]|uniref:Flavin-containing monooxygenase n=1 Tax=Diaporthe vaccinii TaxID=105482 RepID=A0ABR4FBR2_9PEZI
MNQSQIIAGKPVAVIGAGVSGLVAAKRLAAEGFQVSVYERRSQAGGLWNFSPDPNTPFASAVYGDLQTNFHASSWSCRIIHGPANLCSCNTILCRNTLRGTRKIFSRNGTAEYDSTSIPRLCVYIMRHMLEVIGSSLGSQCAQERVVHPSSYTSSWQLVCTTNQRYLNTKDLQHGGNCGGTQSLMRSLIEIQTPLGGRSVPGFQFQTRPSETLNHKRLIISQNVLIVGYQASGFDIANKISTSVSKLWISSTRPVAGGLPANALPMKEVSRFFAAQRWVTFTDGQTIVEVDHIIFCTGYQYHQPFIKKNRYTAEPLFPSGPYIKCLHEHTIYINIPTLAFLGMVRDAVPTFLIVQAQAAFVSRFFADQLRSLRQRDEDSQHRLPYPLFLDYLLRLESLCEKSDNSQEWSVSRYTNPVFRWTYELDLLRTKRREIRDEFLAQPPTTTDVWSTEDMIHHYHWKFICFNFTDNIESIIPFLVLSYGYNGDHRPNSTLPFQGWRLYLGSHFRRCLLETAQDFDSQLGPASSEVISRGRRTLSVLLIERWAEFCHGLPNGDSRDEEEEELLSDDDVLTVAEMSDMESLDMHLVPSYSDSRVTAAQTRLVRTTSGGAIN